MAKPLVRIAAVQLVFVLVIAAILARAATGPVVVRA